MGNKFILTGPRQGQTVNLAGHQFVKGVFDYQGGSKEDIQAVAYHLGTYYGAFHESVAEEAQAKYEADQKVLAAGQVPEPVKPQDPPPVKPQDLTPRTPPTPPTPPTPDPLATVQSVAEALQALDPDKDSDWTGQGLPSVDAVSALLARTATRKEIEEAADGFNRMAAKAAKTA